MKASLDPTTGVLTVLADDSNDTLAIGRNGAGTIQINGGAVPIDGGTPTVANTVLIQAFGQGGDDVISLADDKTPLPDAHLFGGDGNDRLTGGSGDDQLFGQAGDDTLNGRGGADLLFGGDGNDVLTGGAGDDSLFGQAGDDRFVWKPGDGSDTVEGGAGNDTLEVNGGSGADSIAIVANGSRVAIVGSGAAAFTIDAGGVEEIVVTGLGGDDTLTAGNGLATLTHLTLDGGAGNDTIIGGDGGDTLLGGNGNDTVIGGRGNDAAQLGSGADSFVWNPGDGSDTVDGGAGTDTLQINGSNVGERIDLSANGDHARLFRDVGNATMDLARIEHIDLATLGGNDVIAVGDLSGTGVTQVHVDLGNPPGGTAGDGQADTVSVLGREGGDHLAVHGDGGSLTVVGLPAQVSLSNADGFDNLLLGTLGGDDHIDASGLVASAVHLSVDGGTGDDTLRADGTAGDDTIDIAANASHVSLSRDASAPAMDIVRVEHLQFDALTGSDHVAVNDLSGTDVTSVGIDLGEHPGGHGDGLADTVSVTGTQAADTIVATGSGGNALVSGLSATVQVHGADAGLDLLQLNGGGGDDTIDASAFHANGIGLSINGGEGADTLYGGAGNDAVNGGRGNDVAHLGAGDDSFVWNPGDGSDTVVGDAGTDTLQFNGSNVGEKIDLSADGEHVRLFRDVGNATMDLNQVEHLNVATLGGSDTITVNDLTGTGVSQVGIDLGSGAGTGDAQTDVVDINGTSGNDTIRLSLHDGALVVDGLAQQVVISHFDAFDQIHLAGLGGDDVIDASALQAGGPALFFDGGEGNDVLLGGAGDDVLDGGTGEDILIGGAGTDVLLNGEVNLPDLAGHAHVLI